MLANCTIKRHLRLIMLPQVIIIGRPNVGKSTLFNRLVGKRLALVDDTPGVTRDRRLADARIGDLHFQVIDTAGLEEAFVPAKYLVGKNGIRIDQTCAEVTYHHILFDRHEVIVSEGLQTESFLPGDTIRNAMDKETLREILSLFPELSDPKSNRQTQNARPVLKPYEIAALTMVAA